jgi:hypothetical protein
VWALVHNIRYLCFDIQDARLVNDCTDIQIANTRKGGGLRRFVARAQHRKAILVHNGSVQLNPLDPLAGVPIVEVCRVDIKSEHTIADKFIFF